MKNRFKLEEIYADHIVKGMDIKTLEVFAFDNIIDGLRDLSDNEFINMFEDMLDAPIEDFE